ncbi:MAG: gliding motility protein GldN [Flavobacteriales bacterium]|nr:gliding motility protein GldN [Flavobacteriales bacterium]
MTRKIGIGAVALLLASAPCVSSGQTVLDGAYIKEHTKTKRVVPYVHIREADVMWGRRVWRLIDLREKMNHPLYYPVTPTTDRQSLFDVIKQGLITDGSLTAYDDGLGEGDQFKKPLLINEVKNILEKIDTLQTEDPDTGDFVEVYVPVTIEAKDVKWYKVKEDWIFDKQRSKIDIRILGIAPVAEDKDEDGNFRGLKTLFWLYYPECRYVFANFEVFNRENDAERRSFEDVFWKRQFTSTITKWSNVYDRAINQYTTGLDALLEGEKIKEELFVFEHDLWNF